MVLIVEDGTIVAGANSYVSLATVKAYCAARGIIFPADNILEQKVLMAMDWFEHYTFKSDRVDVTTPQDLSYPRVAVTIDGVVTPDTEIPPLVIAIINQATADAITVELEPTIAGSATGSLKKKKLDVIEKEFYEGSWSDNMPNLTKLSRMLEPLIGAGLGVGRLQVYRV